MLWVLVGSSAAGGKAIGEGVPVWITGANLPAPLACMPDKQGRAWFHLPAAGQYTAHYSSPTGTTHAKFRATRPKLNQKPGFAYIQQIKLKPTGK